MAVNKITLKKVVVGTPIKTVTAGSFGIQNLGGVTTTGQVSGSILAFNQSTGNYEIANFTGDSNMFVTYDSCLLYTSPSPRDRTRSRMPSSA